MNIDIKNTETERYISAVRDMSVGKDRRVYVTTLGCQQNEADSEKIRGMAHLMGYSVTETPEDASLIVINTCAIRRHAELKALSILGSFKALKQSDPEITVAVVGCMAAEAHMAEHIKKSYPYVSFTLEPTMIYRFPELLFKSLTEKKRSFVYGQDEGNILEGVEPIRTSAHRAWVSIMYGCNNFCSYCIVPYVRGRERSRDSKEVIAECKGLIADGYREITLLGQNVNSYKSDIDFATLLETVASIDGDFIIRFMTSHPKDVPDKLIEVMAKYSEKIAPAFHLPLQSGSDAVLKAMNRTYDTKRYLAIVEKLREKIPNIAITSDIIVGFPGETDEDFEATMSLLENTRLDMVYSFIYSKREGTRAAKMDDQIDDETKKRRMKRLLDVQCEISHEKNLPYLDTVERVLVDSVSKEGDRCVYSARTLTNKLVHFESDEDRIGEFIDVKIIRVGAFDLFAEVIK